MTMEVVAFGVVSGPNICSNGRPALCSIEAIRVIVNRPTLNPDQTCLHLFIIPASNHGPRKLAYFYNQAFKPA